MAEYLANAAQTVAINSPVLFDNSIPCDCGSVLHENQTGNFILKGGCCCNNCGSERYQVTFNGNIAIPTGGTVGSIAVALAVNGEIRPTSTAIVTPSAVEQYNNVTSTAIINVPKGCCANLSLRAVNADPTEETATAISVQNANLVINKL